MLSREYALDNPFVSFWKIELSGDSLRTQNLLLSSVVAGKLYGTERPAKVTWEVAPLDEGAIFPENLDRELTDI